MIDLNRPCLPRTIELLTTSMDSVFHDAICIGVLHMICPRFVNIPFGFKDYLRNASILSSLAVVFWWALCPFAPFVSCARAKDTLLGVPWPHWGGIGASDVGGWSPVGCTLSGASAAEPESQM